MGNYKKDELTVEEIKRLPIPTYFRLILFELFENYYDGTHRTDFSGSPVVCCPIHHETEPSFRYYEHTNTFHCFGCGISGDVLNLHKEVLKELRGHEPKFHEVLSDLRRILKKLPGDWREDYRNFAVPGNKKKQKEITVSDKNGKQVTLERVFDSSDELSLNEKSLLIDLKRLGSELEDIEDLKKYDTLVRLLNKHYIFPSEAVSELQLQKQ